MGYLVGTDEAGYAPNSGPLVISATAWWVPGNPREADLYRLLRKVVSSTLPRRLSPAGARSDRSSGRRVVLADSKVLYRPPGGLAQLELGLLSTLGLLGPCPASWRQAWTMLDPSADALSEDQPWHVDYDDPLPLEADPDELDCHTTLLRDGAAAAGVKLLTLRSRAIFPDQWNRLIDEHGNKATALSLLTLELLSEVLATLDQEPVVVYCDKHGGRNTYRALLQQHVSDWLVEVYGEGREESVYRWGPADCRTEVLFCTNAERFLPAALASMASKYLRELAMRPFNQFWRRHVPNLRPTAGYPVDAVRFKSDIAAAQTALGIDDRLVWRNR